MSFHFYPIFAIAKINYHFQLKVTYSNLCTKTPNATIKKYWSFGDKIWQKKKTESRIN